MTELYRGFPALFARALTILVPVLLLTACIEDEPEDPIELGGANTFPVALDKLSNQYEYEYRVTSDRSNSHHAHQERGLLTRRYAEISHDAPLVDRLFRVTDRHQPTEADAWQRTYEVGIKRYGEHYTAYRRPDGELVAESDAGAKLVHVPISVGDRYESRLSINGTVDTHTLFVEIKVLDTEWVETPRADIETYVIRIRGDDADDGSFDGTDTLRYTRLLWVSPKFGLVREQLDMRERDSDAHEDVYTRYQYTLTHYAD